LTARGRARDIESQPNHTIRNKETPLIFKKQKGWSVPISQGEHCGLAGMVKACTSPSKIRFEN